MFGFEKLDVWRESIQFANHVYSVTKAFPNDERFGLTSQVRRSAVSVSANIAEGSGRRSPRDFIRFIEIAFGSLMEVISHRTIARDQAILAKTEYEALYEKARKLSRMLSGLRTSLERNQT